ncbi:hypothetical protein IC617_06035 [Neiella sp. HB171785]|uniref:Uncharacterized protein n=1 Tax=Neiella litorisoli TaxID=2771431 RepID=A0A8J6UIS2_9GAMM|nr:hypothetical protein [Neiella litorisoli]MBD1388983.1 hypothetical protein [Neiella litorisoli]
MKKKEPTTAEENMKKQDTSYTGAIFFIILACFIASSYTGLLVFEESGESLMGWAWATIVFSVMLITLLSIPSVLEKSVAAGEQKSKAFSSEQYKVYLYKAIAGVILLIISVCIGYMQSELATLMAIPIVLAINLISEGHHEEIKANGTRISDIATYILFACMTVLYVVGINTLQCEIQTLDVYIIAQTLVISAGFTCNTVFFYLKEHLHKKLEV